MDPAEFLYVSSEVQMLTSEVNVLVSEVEDARTALIPFKEFDTTSLEKHVTLVQKDPRFRTLCAQKSDLWVALEEALSEFDLPNNPDAIPSTWIRTLQTIFRLGQFMLPGVVDAPIEFSLQRFLGTYLEAISRLHLGQSALSSVSVTILRTLANATTIAHRSDLYYLWEFIRDHDVIDEIVSQWRPEFLRPLLHIFTRTADEDPSYLLWDIPLFAVTLVHASKYSEDEASPIFSLAYHLVKQLLGHASLSALWNDINKAIKGDSTGSGLTESQFVSYTHLVLLKFVDGMIHDEENRNGKGIELSDFISIVEDLVYGKIRQILVSPDQFAMEEIETLTSSIRLVIIDLELLLHSPSSTTFTDSSISDLYYLRLLMEHIPIQQPSSRMADSFPSRIRELFKGQKRDLIILLTQLLNLDKSVQDTIRENGGIPLILSQTNIDDDNPYVKERATVCIRLLLEGNEANQELIRQLTPQPQPQMQHP